MTMIGHFGDCSFPFSAPRFPYYCFKTKNTMNNLDNFLYEFRTTTVWVDRQRSTD